MPFLADSDKLSQFWWMSARILPAADGSNLQLPQGGFAVVAANSFAGVIHVAILFAGTNLTANSFARVSVILN